MIGMGFLLLIIIIIIIIIVSLLHSKYQNDSFIESKEIIINPDQGFYSPIYITITPDTFEPRYENNYNLYHLRCDISQFSSAVNSEKKIKN